MNKAVPWSVKGVGFDAREVAYMAARKAGVPIGEWLNSVINDHAQALGVSAAQFTADDRVDALVARLAGVAESGAPADGSDEVQTAVARRRAPAVRSAGAQPMSHYPIEEEAEAPRRVRRVANGADAFDWSPGAATRQAPPEKRDHLADWESDMLLDQALELVEKRSSASLDSTGAERQRLTVAALAKEVDRLNRGEPEAAAERRPAAMREPARPVRRAETPRPIRDAVGSVAERLEEIESRIAHRDADLANRPIVAALGRLEDRFEHLLRRNVEGARESSRVESTFRDLDSRLRYIASRLERGEHNLPARSMADVERIDGDLAAVLSRLDAAPPRGAPWDEAAPSDQKPGRRSHRDTIAEIARRQADLDEAELNRASLLRGTSYASIGQAQREAPQQDAAATPARAGAEAPRADAPGDLENFSALQEAFARLTERMETKLDQAAKARPPSPDAWSDDIGALKTGIAALADRLDALKQQNDDDSVSRSEHDDFDAVRNEIAALQLGLAKLAPQSSITSLEEAVRDLGGRIESSRRIGVTEAVLEPLERLRQEVREVLDEQDLRGTIGAVEHQLQSIGRRMEGIEQQGFDRGVFNAMHDNTREVRDLLRQATAQFQAAERLEHQIGHLGERVDQLVEAPPRSAIRELELAVNEIRTMLVQFSPDSAIQDVSRKLDSFAERFDLIESQASVPVAMFDEFSRRLEQAHASLAERLIKAAPTSVNLRPLEEMIGGLSGKIDGLSRTSHDVQALGGLVRGLAAQIEEARLPNADVTIIDTLEKQVGNLAERLDRSDQSLDAINSVERLVRELFHQIDESRVATIDAAEMAARNAAQETLRAALVNPSIAGEEASSRATRVVEQVGQELSEFRKSQQTSEKRVHSTLLALNETLERMVDRMVVPQTTPAYSAPRAEPVEAVPVVRVAARAEDKAVAEPPVLLETSKPTEQPVVRDAQPAEPKRAAAVKAAPTVEIGRPTPSMPMPDVSPLIAAARRAAQAAQASSAAAAVRDVAPSAKVAAKTAEPASAKPWRTMFRHKRPVLLSVASVVLLLGALQLVRLSQTSDTSGTDTQEATAETKTQSPVEPAVASVPSVTAAQPADTSAKGQDAASLLSGEAAKTDSSVAPASASSFVATDPAPKSLPAGLRDLADRGDPAAQYEVGARLAEGRGIDRDAKTAAGWFERAAKQGYAPAEYRIGSLYEKGVGVPAEPATALSWYEKAANQGNVRSMHNLAVMAAEGSVGRPDYIRAASWFTKAAQHGVRDSQYNLAILYARGLGLAQDLAQSYTWFAIAAGQGDADAGKKRDDVAAKLDAGKIAAAKVAVDAFKPTPTDHAANDVTPPASGWDVVAPAKGTTPSPRISSM